MSVTFAGICVVRRHAPQSDDSLPAQNGVACDQQRTAAQRHPRTGRRKHFGDPQNGPRGARGRQPESTSSITLLCGPRRSHDWGHMTTGQRMTAFARRLSVHM
uniref:Uncharacterized protein n=1 Tax=Eutreptiella gymnastica TaxID=73025 RepID=A0A7S4C9D2_9EUGL